MDKKDILHVASIARLKLDDEEVKKFLRDLNNVLEAFEEMNKIKTDNIKPSFHPLNLKDRMRDDEEEKCLSQEKALGNTKHKENGFFKGPRIV